MLRPLEHLCHWHDIVVVEHISVPLAAESVRIPGEPLRRRDPPLSNRLEQVGGQDSECPGSLAQEIF